MRVMSDVKNIKVALELFNLLLDLLHLVEVGSVLSVHGLGMELMDPLSSLQELEGTDHVTIVRDGVQSWDFVRKWL